MATTLLKPKDSRLRSPAPVVPSSRIWHASAPARVTEAKSWSASGDGWRAWQKHLQERRQPTSVNELFAARGKQLLWGTGTLELEDQSRELLTILSRAVGGNRAAVRTAAELLELWLAESEGGPRSAPFALECVAWAYALPALAPHTPATLWWELLELLLNLAARSPRNGDPSSLLVRHLCEAELPLVLACWLPEILSCRALAAGGFHHLSESLAESANEDVLLLSGSLPELRGRLASWTRGVTIARQLPQVGTKEIETSLSKVLLTALRVTRADGRQVFDETGLRDRPVELFGAALAEAKNAQVQSIMKPPRAGSRMMRRRGASLLTAACHSEQAGFGLLRRGWSIDGEMLAVRYGGDRLSVELSTGREVVCSGTWSIELEADGKPLAQRSDWDHVCWVSDKDVDYLELEARFSGGMRVQRQMLLAREDRLLYLADAVLGQADCHLRYRGVLPLLPTIDVLPADETREVGLGGRRGVVQPLALPEWRRDLRGGSLARTEAGLELIQHRAGRRMYAPLLVDLDPRRARQPRTWRQLTVAEDRKAVSGDLAVGYRVRIGRRQWLIYRSLAERANRTLLGSNLSTEFLFARFTPDGEAQALLEIE